MEKPNKLDNSSSQEGVVYKEIQKFGDDRGEFTNIEFEDAFKGEFKRCYLIKNNQKNVVRAFHGHKNENKLFYVPKGAFKFIIMHMETMEWKEYSLLASVPKILFVPKGYYNGFVSLTDDNLLLVYSSSTMKESKEDDFRLPYDHLGKEVWQINHR